MTHVKSKWFSNGLAMFSMFFGAGNVIFPLMIGMGTKSYVFYALIGLFITAILIPFSGLLSITLFQGDYIRFFKRIGRVPGAILTILVISVLCPFGAIPRCVALTYSSFQVYFPTISLFWFSLASCIVVFVCCMRKQKILDLLGYVLTPLLLVFLVLIILKGFFLSPDPSDVTPINAFSLGLIEGYNTMDLLAAFFFSSIICMRFKQEHKGESSPHELTVHLIKASIVGAGLLTLVYIGFGYIASVYSLELSHVRPDQLLGVIGKISFGHYAGLIVCSAVAISCLTTAIALTLVASDFLQKVIFSNKMPYILCLIIILGLTWLTTFLQFSGIVRLVGPILQICYPALLVLSILNIFYKLYDFKPVKIPFFAVLLVFLIIYLMR